MNALSRSKLFLAALAVVATAGVAMADKPTKTYNMHESCGSTRAHGKVWVVEKDDGTIFSQIQVGVRKTGVNGTGWGCVHVMFLDKDGNVLFHRGQTKTVGAVLRGDSGEQDSPMQKFDIGKDIASRVVTVVTVTEIEDNVGIEGELENFKKKIKDLLKELIDGGQKPEPGKEQKKKNGMVFEALK